jgi:hypothetical protein
MTGYAAPIPSYRARLRPQQRPSQTWGGPGIWVIVELRNEMKWHAMLSDQSASFTARDGCDPQV